MSAPTLRRIEAELTKLAKDAEDHPADPSDIRLQARRIGALAEQIEQGIVE